jgi:hypothetical protein
MEVDLTQNIVKLLNEPNGRIAFTVYVLACLLGQIVHAAWMWLNKKIPCVMDRFREDARATVVSIITNVGGVISMAVVIPFEGMPLEGAIVMGILQGISSDSVVNKTAHPPREVWTPAQRAAATGADADATHPGP